MKWLLSCLSILSVLILPQSAHAIVLNFDDLVLGGTYVALPDLNYGGFTWDSRWSAGTTANNTYDNGASSGDTYLSNTFGVNDIGFSNSTAFDLDGLSIAHPDRSFNIATQVQIFGLDSSDNVLYQTAPLNISSTHQFISTDFDDINKVNIRYTAPNTTGWFVIDDVTYNTEGHTGSNQGSDDHNPVDDPNAVPEPATLAMLTLGVGLMTVRKRFVQ